MATQLEKLEKKALKEQQKVEKKALKEQQKIEKQSSKAVAKVKQKVIKTQRKIESKPAKAAAKAFKPKSQPRKALNHLQKAQRDFVSLPPILWPLVAVVAFIWARNSYEKEQRERAIKEAREFLRKSRDIRI